MKSVFKQVELSCICESGEFELIFAYDRPPKGEIVFSRGKHEKYYRELVKCINCGHYRSTHNMFSGDIYTGKYVNANYHDLPGLRKEFDRISSLPPFQSDNDGRIKRIIDFIRSYFRDRNVEDCSILDVGSGLGVFPYGMRKEGWNILSLDPDPLACIHMKELGLDVIQGRFLETQINSCFNLITFNKVVEHIANPLEFLKHAKKLLFDEGVIYVEVPDGETAAREGYHRKEFSVIHPHVFSSNSLSILMKKAGFLEIEQQQLKEPSGKYTLRSFGKRI